MNEKKAIELATAEAFLRLYNKQIGSSYKIVMHSDAPDFLCRDESGRELKLEVTLTEDRPGDIAAQLGRSDARSLEALKRHNEAVKQGKENAFQWTSCLQGNVVRMIGRRIQAKLKKDYGRNAALVVRDTSPLSWDWNMVFKDLAASLDPRHNPFDEGIWILTFNKDKIYRVV